MIQLFDIHIQNIFFKNAKHIIIFNFNVVTVWYRVSYFPSSFKAVFKQAEVFKKIRRREPVFKHQKKRRRLTHRTVHHHKNLCLLKLNIDKSETNNAGNRKHQKSYRDDLSTSGTGDFLRNLRLYPQWHIILWETKDYDGIKTPLKFNVNWTIRPV